MPDHQELTSNSPQEGDYASATISNTILLIPTLFLGLFVASLWTIDHYWRNLTVSWLATISVTYFTAENYHVTTPIQNVWLFALTSTLLLWSLLLTPVQLFFKSAKDRTPIAQVEIISDPSKSGSTSNTITAEYVVIFEGTS
jgi:hypothetical protein